MRWSLLALLGWPLAGCAQPPTEILVEVESDIPSTELIRVHASVANLGEDPPDGGGDTAHYDFDVRGGGVPFSFGVIPRHGDPTERVRITVSTMTTAGVVARSAVLQFVAGRRPRLTLFLARGCAAVVCAVDRTCDPATTACAADTVDVTTLPLDTDGGAPTDAGGSDTSSPFGCHGAALPSTAPSTIALSGATVALGSHPPTAITAATVDVLGPTGTTALGTTTSSGSGAFALSVATGGAPIDGCLHAATSGQVDTYFYPAAPFSSDDATANVPLVTTSIEGTLYALAGTTHTAGTGTLVVDVIDCLGTPVAGATISSMPSGTRAYDDASGLLSVGATMTASDGLAYVLNVGPGTVTVGAAGVGTAFRSHAVNVRADVLTVARVAP